MRKRENELKQELNMATLRCEELKRTMIETKSFIDPLHTGERFQISLSPKASITATLRAISSLFHSTTICLSAVLSSNLLLGLFCIVNRGREA